MHQSSYDKMKKFRDSYLDPSAELRILDVGGFDVNGTYRDLFSRSNYTYHSVDMMEGNNVDIALENPYDWNTIKSNSYDVVISGQAYEHIEYFWITTLQINRVLKEGGLACIIAPASGQEHRYPVDCWRYYPDGLKTIAKWAKMEVLEAWTQWQDLHYDDGSDVWKDSILICMKLSNIPEIDNVIRILNTWIGIVQSPEIKNINVNTTKIHDIHKDNIEKFTFMLKSKLLSNPKIFPEWYEAIHYLMLVYSERLDLKKAFAEVSNSGDLSRLFCWAKDFGTIEDPRLTPYHDLYKKFCKS